MIKSESVLKLAPALLKTQKEMGSAVKDAKNPYYKSSYADLNSVREAVTPALHNNGCILLQPTVTIDGKPFVETMILHESGEFICSYTEVVCSKPNDPQAYGSAISYARRYGLQSLLSVGTADDDAESATIRQTVQPVKKTETTKAAPATAANGAYGSFRKPPAADAAKNG